MEGRAAPGRTFDVPTLLYAVYIAAFFVLLVVGGLVFGFNQATVAFAFFAIIVIVMIGFTSRIIYHG